MDLNQTLSCLGQRERTIIHLKFYAGLSQTEIAKRIGISQMHVSRLQRDVRWTPKFGQVAKRESRS